MLPYLTKTEKTAKSVEEAKALALSELGLSEDEVDIEVKDEGTKGFLGFGSKDATVSVTVKDPCLYAAKRFLSRIFEKMGLEVELSGKNDGSTVFIEMSGEHMGLVIGKRGETLDALQYLSSLVVNRISENRMRVILDTENYRQKRSTALVTLASRIASKVAKTGKKHTLEPMNPYERRIIHSCLQSNDEVTTYSVDEEPYRRVVIAPKNSKSHYDNSTPHISSRISSEYRQQNHNKVKSYDDFLAENSED